MMKVFRRKAWKGYAKAGSMWCWSKEAFPLTLTHNPKGGGGGGGGVFLTNPRGGGGGGGGKNEPGGY
ncbi:hypothetical protein GD422_00955 [Enterobacter hormaechei]|nr:hypothetical protein [Enterobacter hormaechei]